MSDIQNHGYSEHDRLYEEGVSRIRPYISNEASGVLTEEARTQLEEGVDLLKEALLFFPTNWSAHWFVGKAYESLKRPEASYQYFKQAYDIMPDHADVAWDLASACLLLGKSKEAVSAAWHATEVRPEDANYLANFAMALLADGQTEQARAIATRALHMAPDNRRTQSLLETVDQVRSGKAIAQAALRPLLR